MPFDAAARSVGYCLCHVFSGRSNKVQVFNRFNIMDALRQHCASL